MKRILETGKAEKGDVLLFVLIRIPLSWQPRWGPFVLKWANA